MTYGDSLFNRTRDTRTPVRPDPILQSKPPGSIGAANPAAAPASAAVPAPAKEPAPSSDAQANATPAASRLIVGPNIKLRGVEIDDCDTLVVEGRVEATMVSREIQIAENGAFNGKVDVDVAEIRGAFQGEMTARRRLVIHASGRVTGKIRYGKVQVQEGGEMSGDIGSLGPDSAVVRAA